jgi:hypothetical protein
MAVPDFFPIQRCRSPFIFFDRNAQKRASQKQDASDSFFLTRVGWDHTDDTANDKMEQ